MSACMCVWMADKPATCVSMMCKLATSTSPARVLQACCAIGRCWLYMCVYVCVCVRVRMGLGWQTLSLMFVSICKLAMQQLADKVCL